MSVTPFPLAVPGPDPCQPGGGPSKVVTPGASKLNTDQVAVVGPTNAQNIPTRLTGVDANARVRTVTNQGDKAGNGSVIYVTSGDQKGSAATSGVLIPVGAGRDFHYTGELWAFSDPTGLPAVGYNIVDVATEYDA